MEYCKLKIGDIVRIKTYKEMLDLIGDDEFTGISFFKSHGNMLARVTHIKSEENVPIIHTDSPDGGIGVKLDTKDAYRDSWIARQAVEKVYTGISLSNDLFEL